MAAMRAGSREAEEKFVASYGSHLRRIARRHLATWMRREFDSEDIVQSVWGAVFDVRERLYALRQPADVIRYLSRAVRNRLVDKYRRRMRGQGSVEVRAKPRSLDGLKDDSAIFAKDATPSQAAAVMELLTRLQQPSNDPQTDVVRWYILGQSFVEIAEELGRHPDDVRRLFREFIREYRRG